MEVKNNFQGIFTVNNVGKGINYRGSNRSEEKYLVIIVDIDDDVGRKANIKTPVLGRSDCINAAIRLGLADPGDTDVNSILGGVKLYDDLKKEEKDVELALISGYKNVESKECAKRIKEQLDFLLYLYEPTFVYFVSDGKEDELVLKYLENKDVFVWKKRIVVKQSESLESTYYLVQEFLEKTMSQYLPFIFTSIGFAMVIYAIFADLGWRIIVGIVGLYILSEGSGLTKDLKKAFKEGKKSFEFRRLTPMGNVIAIVITTIGALYSYSMAHTKDLVNFVGIFLHYFTDMFVLSMFIILVAHSIDDIIYSSKDVLDILKRFLFGIVILFILREILLKFSDLLCGKTQFIELIVSVILYTLITGILFVVLFYNRSRKRYR
ncbi:DUF373 family protein [Methanofervidicoccus abyssi]|uniref:DUF373 family protein n=1 Tax=Methanofervidicoccus abyssi TaxID=2082189 RepID=A0A401HQ13_9EURY|nr:DUF373 family protein [Methanofervidicoccus abyssi]GBF36356.1 conserved hypothetical protein [Methanofervidicoccus abyssi]